MRNSRLQNLIREYIIFNVSVFIIGEGKYIGVRYTELYDYDVMLKLES